MLLLQHKMKDLLSQEEVGSTEEQMFSQVLGTQPGYVRGMGNSVIPPPSSSWLSHVTQLNRELEHYKEKWEQAEQHWAEVEEKQKETDRQLVFLMEKFGSSTSLVADPCYHP